jgi:biopolymer transport protein ExbD
MACERMRDRLSVDPPWNPSALLLVGIVSVILVAAMVNGINQRLGNPSVPLSFPSQPQSDTAIWLSITPIDEKVVVTTNDRSVFTWPQNAATDTDTKELTKWLSQQVQTEIASTALAGMARSTQTKVMISADQHLKFLHVKPVLYALASAGITRYGFETDLTDLEATDSGQLEPSLEDSKDKHPEETQSSTEH